MDPGWQLALVKVHVFEMEVYDPEVIPMDAQVKLVGSEACIIQFHSVPMLVTTD